MADQEEITKGAMWSVNRMAALAAAICLLLNIRALFCGFSPMDDHIYVQSNTAIRNLDVNLLRWAFTAPPVDFWQPLTWISFAIDYRIWGLNPFGYHLTNILLHAGNCSLVVLLADRLPDWLTAHLRSADRPKILYPFTLLLAALLFGMHPLRVESVVWITERKDVLSGLFFLCSILFYLEYVSRRSGESHAGVGRFYLLSLCTFLLGLMVKPVGVVLPLMLLVLDWYPLARFKRGALTRVFADKIPFLLFSCAISALTLYHAASNRILRPYGFLSIGERLVISGNAIFEYCRLLVLPLGINPLQLITLPLPGIWTVKSAIAGIACLLVYAGRKQRWLPAVWLCFLLPLLPVLAIFQNGDQALAARYTYLPSIAPCIATAILIATACVRLGENGAGPLRNTLVAAVFACLLFYAGMTFYLTKVWDNGETYWTRVVAMQPIAMPFFERGEFYDKSGRYAEAISDYTAALERASGDHRRYSYNIYAFRGEAYRSIGNYAEAVRDLTTAIRMSPHRIYYYCRGMALKELGQSVEAEEDFKIAGGEKGTIGFWYKDPDTEEIERLLRANSADAAALHQRGMAALRGREYGKSLEDFTKAISLQPSKPDYYWSRSTVYLENGKLDRALADCNEVLRLDAGNRDAYLRRASISAEKGDYGKALADIDSLLSLDPANYAGYANRGLLLYQQGKLSAAISDFDAAIRLSPEPAPIYYNRGLAHAAAGSAAKARSDLLRARDLGYQFDETEIKRILFTNQH